MALFDMLIKHNINFVVAHVNYHHRDSALRDELIVKEFAEKNNISFYKKDYEEGKGNFQDLARVFRYNFFRDLVAKLNLNGVIVAHHQDDLIETYLLQIDRGSTPSIYGLAAITSLNGLDVYRPLLNYSKAELERYCITSKIPFGIDESNLTDDFKRNEIRHNVVTKYSKDEREEILNKIKNLNKEIEDRKNNLKEYLDREYLTIDEFRNLKDQEMYLRLKVDMSLSNEYINEIINQILNSNKMTMNINGRMISKEYEKLYVFTCNSDYSYILNKDDLITTPFFQIKNEGKKIESIYLNDNDYPLTIRNYKEGDAIEMRFGTKKVNRFFIDRKIPLKYRQTWPVVENAKGEIIHVSGIGSNPSHYNNSPTLFMIKY